MKTPKPFFILWLFGIIFPLFQSYAQPFNYELVWATYFGDENLTIAANAVDKEGNIYFVGRVTEGSFFPATTGCHQPLYGGGTSDGFLVKMNPEGQVIWATYYGGDMSEYISGVSLDANDNLYVIGSTSSPIGIATPESYQPEIERDVATFIAKFNRDGIRIWATYYADRNTTNTDFSRSGIMSVGHMVVTDGTGAVYFANGTDKLDAATPGTFQTDIGQATNTLVSKFSSNGERLWATYYGVYNSTVSSLAISADGLYLGGTTLECAPFGQYNTYFGTVGSHQPEPGNCNDVFISKFSFDGQRIWSTYYGNTNREYMGKNAIVCFGDAVYFSGISSFAPAITTSGSYQENSDHAFTPYLVKFNASGERQWGTYFGLELDPLGESILPYAKLNKDSQGNIYMLGNTRFQENISTPGAFQEEKAQKGDNYLAIFHPSGQLLYGTYYGGDGEEYGSSPLVYGHTVYMFGQTGSTEGIATAGSYQPNYMTSTDTRLETNIYIAKFAPEGLGIEDLTTENFSVYPNPNNGIFTIRTKVNTIFSLEVFNVLGQRMEKTWTTLNTDEVQIQGLGSGLYFVKVILDDGRSATVKVVVE